jgi:hypothetical protein
MSHTVNDCTVYWRTRLNMGLSVCLSVCLSIETTYLAPDVEKHHHSALQKTILIASKEHDNQRNKTKNQAQRDHDTAQRCSEHVSIL